MSTIVRTYASAGIALVAAGVIAVAPVAQAPPPEIRIAAPTVQLAAFPYIFDNPVELLLRSVIARTR